MSVCKSINVSKLLKVTLITQTFHEQVKKASLIMFSRYPVFFFEELGLETIFFFMFLFFFFFILLRRKLVSIFLVPLLEITFSLEEFLDMSMTTVFLLMHTSSSADQFYSCRRIAENVENYKKDTRKKSRCFWWR